jgi:hypothetical protein
MDFRSSVKMALPVFSGDIRQFLADRHNSYFRKAAAYKAAYYGFRIVAGLSAVLLPFTLPYSQVAAACLSILVAVITLLDTVLCPKREMETQYDGG